MAPLLLLVGAETVFRLLGFRPRGAYLKRVDRLVVYDNFYADADGIYKARTDYAWEPGVEVNADGFRSPPFGSGTASNRIGILVLGDSFGWGYSAQPITRSFPDLLRAGPDFQVFNLSIPGTGPEQYALAGAKYIPLLRPGICAVCVYLGNDINLTMAPTHLVIHTPAEKKWCVANAGIFSAYDARAARALSPEEAYRRAMTPAVRALNLLRRTAAGTQLVNWLYDAVYHRRVRNDARRREVNGELIEALQWLSGVCASNGCRLVVFPIPVNPMMRNTRNSARDNACLFEGFEVFIPTNLDLGDYAPFPDDHFNNAGHAKMRDHIEQAVRSLWREPGD